MKFLVLFVITLGAMLGFCWLFIFCRRRLHRTRHGLSGMCHESGGTMCPSCRQAMDDPTCSRLKPSSGAAIQSDSRPDANGC